MLIADMPNVPPQNVPAIIAQANQTQAGRATTTRAIGVCHPAPSNEYSGDNGLAPLTSAQAYFRLFEHRTVTGPATITIQQQPKHGVLRLLTEADGNTFGEGRFVAADQLYVYLPEQGYLGDDRGTILVDFGGGNQVRVKYYFQAIEGMLGNTGLDTLCSPKGVYWKISANIY